VIFQVTRRGRHADLYDRTEKRSPGLSAAAEVIEVAFLAVCQEVAAASILATAVVHREAAPVVDRSTLPMWVTLTVFVGLVGLC
jgi:hypothetical protein